jgi:hypothetical protein
MSPRNEVFQAVPFDGATSDAKEPLIATGDAEEEDQGLEERALWSFKLSSLLLGLLAGFFFEFSTALGVPVLVTYFEVKSTTNVIVFILLWNLFTAVAPFVLILVFIRNWGHSEALREDMITQLECYFGVGVYAGICLAFILVDVILGNPAHVVEYTFTFVSMVVVFIWYKVMMASPATDTSKPSSTRSVSTAEQTTV